MNADERPTTSDPTTAASSSSPQQVLRLHLDLPESSDEKTKAELDTSIVERSQWRSYQFGILAGAVALGIGVVVYLKRTQ
ncbi:hypothetical protein LINGRAHAP2_LOCUS10820 [Linum grandiflorum]